MERKMNAGVLKTMEKSLLSLKEINSSLSKYMMNLQGNGSKAKK